MLINKQFVLILGSIIISLLSPPALAEQLQVRCDTLYSGIKPLSVDEAAKILQAFDKSDFKPLKGDEGHVELRVEIGQGCQWYANKDNKTGKPLEHGKPVELGEGDSILAYVSVEGAPEELGLTPGSNFPIRMQDAVTFLALTENKAATEFAPFWQLAEHEFTASGDPVDYPEADKRARDFSARFYQNPITLQPGKGQVSQDGEIVLTWEIDGFKPSEEAWHGNWANLGNFYMANETARQQCQGAWLGRTSQEPGFSATVHAGPLANVEFTKLQAGQLNQDCVYEW